MEKLAEELDDHEVVEEPYVQLEEEGHEFAHPPSFDDFVTQLERSLELMFDRRPNLLFDRSPVDFVGYLAAHPDGAGFELDDWLEQIRAATSGLDLLVFVPIEDPDRIKVDRGEDLDFRAAVDAKLKEILLDEPLDLGVAVLVVEGKRRERLAQVLERVKRG